ncbi:hypothetical protein SKAU_G00067560 [Synaphobranchus kaupii]|uniref:Uncharacterized protein n=1 Tax=Synaphobranchus kaupii TaxID=118154 RepID=A0A9Q1G715_SYNKA|nr:hypothetical protein SKAU_G00067560 [Synaphobranchus kaupii]
MISIKHMLMSRSTILTSVPPRAASESQPYRTRLNEGRGDKRGRRSWSGTCMTELDLPAPRSDWVCGCVHTHVDIIIAPQLNHEACQILSALGCKLSLSELQDHTSCLLAQGLGRCHISPWCSAWIRPVAAKALQGSLANSRQPSTLTKLLDWPEIA